MSVVSELRALATALEKNADDISALDHKPDMREEMRGIATGMRLCALEARKFALRAETSIECRTDERPRFARLKAPPRPAPRPPAEVIEAWKRAKLGDSPADRYRETVGQVRDHQPEFAAGRVLDIVPGPICGTFRGEIRLFAGHPSGRGHGPGGRLEPMADDLIEVHVPLGWQVSRFSSVGPHFWKAERKRDDGNERWRWPHLVSIGVKGFCCDTCNPPPLREGDLDR